MILASRTNYCSKSRLVSGSNLNDRSISPSLNVPPFLSPYIIFLFRDIFLNGSMDCKILLWFFLSFETVTLVARIRVFPIVVWPGTLWNLVEYAQANRDLTGTGSNFRDKNCDKWCSMCFPYIFGRRRIWKKKKITTHFSRVKNKGINKN